jgi:hypothetical protein
LAVGSLVSGARCHTLGGSWTYDWRWVQTTLFVWGIAGPPPPLPGSRWQYRANSPIVASAAVAHDLVYVASERGTLTALELQTGTPRWSFAARKAISASPVVAGDVLYVASYDQTLSALDASRNAPLQFTASAPSMPSWAMGACMWRWTGRTPCDEMRTPPSSACYYSTAVRASALNGFWFACKVRISLDVGGSVLRVSHFRTPVEILTKVLDGAWIITGQAQPSTASVATVVGATARSQPSSPQWQKPRRRVHKCASISRFGSLCCAAENLAIACLMLPCWPIPGLCRPAAPRFSLRLKIQRVLLKRAGRPTALHRASHT